MGSEPSFTPAPDPPKRAHVLASASPVADQCPQLALAILGHGKHCVLKKSCGVGKYRVAVSRIRRLGTASALLTGRPISSGAFALRWVGPGRAGRAGRGVTGQKHGSDRAALEFPEPGVNGWIVRPEMPPLWRGLHQVAILPDEVLTRCSQAAQRSVAAIRYPTASRSSSAPATRPCQWTVA